MTEEELRERIAAVRENIAAAAKESGRDPSDITLIAVSKTVDAPTVRLACACGQTVFGENRVQELCKKQEELADPTLHWHLIGHLQTNKIRQVIGRTELIHSVDSLHLLEALEQEAARAEQTVRMLFQVNVSGEESKFGFSPADLDRAAAAAADCEHLKLCGLMTVPPPVEQPSENRRYFSALRELAQRLGKTHGVGMELLSMGMSGDYTAAIAEGANLVRVGTSVFGARNYSAVSAENK